ncbi:hypothetical protein Pyn_00383 [Prunus yedoensis var. nudiflora]|uniref:Uncharacterized protein n=1 Tax=Prunus yedoensis var. nudiflora TaxID=2094558 RepID=A0A314ZA97_PRUYE|nr:hypothetical protein Pyn_00383 [Prunus yedoensis var. nudiflora]
MVAGFRRTVSRLPKEAILREREREREERRRQNHRTYDVKEAEVHKDEEELAFAKMKRNSRSRRGRGARVVVNPRLRLGSRAVGIWDLDPRSNIQPMIQLSPSNNRLDPCAF